jgi:hypothetical protein
MWKLTHETTVLTGDPGLADVASAEVEMISVIKSRAKVLM